MTLKTYKVGVSTLSVAVRAGSAGEQHSEANEVRRDKLIRMCSPDQLYPGMACEYDLTTNILKINRDLYEAANEKTRQKLWRANESLSSLS